MKEDTKPHLTPHQDVTLTLPNNNTLRGTFQTYYTLDKGACIIQVILHGNTFVSGFAVNLLKNIKED